MLLHIIVWYCMVFYDIAWYCIVLFDIVWYCMALHGILCYYMVLYCISLYGIAKTGLPPLLMGLGPCVIFHCLQLTVMAG